jgi:hypothetical protein
MTHPREENHHPELVKAVLNSQVPLDLAPFEVHLGTILPKTESSAIAASNLCAVEPPSYDPDSQGYSYPLPEGLLFDDPDLVDV